MRVHNDGRGYLDQQQNGLIRYIVGDGYIEYDPKSETDVRLSYAIWQRAQHFRIVNNGDGVLLKTSCSTCGFPMVTAGFLFGGIVAHKRFDACPICGEPVPTGLASEEVKQECE